MTTSTQASDFHKELVRGHYLGEATKVAQKLMEEENYQGPFEEDLRKTLAEARPSYDKQSNDGDLVRLQEEIDEMVKKLLQSKRYISEYLETEENNLNKALPSFLQEKGSFNLEFYTEALRKIISALEEKRNKENAHRESINILCNKEYSYKNQARNIVRSLCVGVEKGDVITYGGIEYLAEHWYLNKTYKYGSGHFYVLQLVVRKKLKTKGYSKNTEVLDIASKEDFQVRQKNNPCWKYESIVSINKESYEELYTGVR